MIALFGSNGYVGSAISRTLAHNSRGFQCMTAPRIESSPDSSAIDGAAEWIRYHQQEYAHLVSGLADTDKVINAAGIASASSLRSKMLWGANAVLPVVLARAASEAGSTSFVQVSSAAVLGDHKLLNEEPSNGGFSPYSNAKAAAEVALAALMGETVMSISIYRPASVVSAEKMLMRQLKSVLRSRYFIAPGSGDVPLPICDLRNVALAAIFLADLRRNGIILHPWESVTTASLARTLGRQDSIPEMPQHLSTILRKVLRHAVRVPHVGPKLRRLQLLLFGQRQVSSLETLGFVLECGLPSLLPN